MTGHRRSAGASVWGRVAAVVTMAIVPHSLAGQEVTWELRGIRSGFCVEFLIAPAFMAATPFGARAGTPAEQDSALSPVLARAVTGADSLRSWIPSNLCLVQADSSGTGGELRRSGRPVTVMVWMLNPGAASAAPAVLFASADRLRTVERLNHSAEVAPLEATFDQDSATGQRVITVQIDQSRLVWDGFLLPDSSTTPVLAAASLELMGDLPHWRATWRVQPQERRRVQGGLRITGTGLLASILAASPVRWVGEYWLGGQARLTAAR